MHACACFQRQELLSMLRAKCLLADTWLYSITYFMHCNLVSTKLKLLRNQYRYIISRYIQRHLAQEVKENGLMKPFTRISIIHYLLYVYVNLTKVVEAEYSFIKTLALMYL